MINHHKIGTYKFNNGLAAHVVKGIRFDGTVEMMTFYDVAIKGTLSDEILTLMSGKSYGLSKAAPDAALWYRGFRVIETENQIIKNPRII